MNKLKLKFASMAVAVVTFLVNIPCGIDRRLRNGTFGYLAANAFTPATHQNFTTKFTATAIATRYLLGKSDGTQTGVVTCNAGDRAMFVIFDTASSATDLVLDNPAPVNCAILGLINETVPMIAAAGGITPGSIVYPVANGQVNTYVGLGSTGSNYPCGIVIANGSAQAGDIMEVAPLMSDNVSTN